MESQRRVAVVTGASAGVGRATVRLLAERGWDVGLLARGRAGLEGAARDVEERGGRALAVPTDVADAEAVEAAAERVERGAGPDRRLGQQRHDLRLLAREGDGAARSTSG